MRVAVTGSAGFIGRHLVARLRAEGHQVVGVDVTGDDPVDVLDLPALTKAVDGVEAVYHLAAEAFVDAAHRDPVRAVELNVLGTVNVLEAARTVGADVLLASTVWAYGASHTVAASVVDETFPFSVERSGHVYTSSKLAAEMFACDYAARYGVRATVLRLGIPYGPFMRSEAVLPGSSPRSSTDARSCFRAAAPSGASSCTSAIWPPGSSRRCGARPSMPSTT